MGCLLQLIILSMLYHHLHSENIDCDPNNPAGVSAGICQCSKAISGESCFLSCAGTDKPCYQDDILCRDGDDCYVNCDGSRSCRASYLACPKNGNCHLTCNGHNNVCIRLIVNITDTLDFTCIDDGIGDCSDITIDPIPPSSPPTRSPIITNAPTYSPITTQPTNQPTTSPLPSFPTTAAPTTDTPTTNEPTRSPASAAPTNNPTTIAPTMSPITSIPTTSHPTPVIPTTSGPTRNPTKQPTTLPTATPTTSHPTTSVPTTADPTTNTPTKHPITSLSTTAIPTTNIPSNSPITSTPTTIMPTNNPVQTSPVETANYTFCTDDDSHTNAGFVTVNEWSNVVCEFCVCSESNSGLICDIIDFHNPKRYDSYLIGKFMQTCGLDQECSFRNVGLKSASDEVTDCDCDLFHCVPQGNNANVYGYSLGVNSLILIAVWIIFL